MLKDVVEVRPVGGHRLFVKFEDGVQGEIDIAGLVQFDGVFAVLRDPAKFAEAFIDLGTVSWPNGADIAPEVLYAKLSNRPLSV